MLVISSVGKKFGQTCNHASVFEIGSDVQSTSPLSQELLPPQIRRIGAGASCVGASPKATLTPMQNEYSTPACSVAHSVVPRLAVRSANIPEPTGSATNDLPVSAGRGLRVGSTVGSPVHATQPIGTAVGGTPEVMGPVSVAPSNDGLLTQIPPGVMSASSELFVG